jgi:hypothetical protein
MSPMEKYLNMLIMNGSTPESEGVEVQIVFKPGAGGSAGGLRRARQPGTGKIIDGLYEFVTAAKPGANAPLEIRALDHIMISEIFAADAIQRVITQVNIEKPSSIIPSC